MQGGIFMKKRILITFILVFGVFGLLCASKNIAATINREKTASASGSVEFEIPEIIATPSVNDFSMRSQKPSQDPHLADVETTPPADLGISSSASDTENEAKPSLSPLINQNTQQIQISRPKKVLLKPGQTTNFRIFLMPVSIAEAQVEFEIEDESIAALSPCSFSEELEKNKACSITGIKPGRTVINITVTSENRIYTDSCIIIVEDDLM